MPPRSLSLLPRFPLCETALRADEEAETQRRWNRAHSPETHELEKAG